MTPIIFINCHESPFLDDILMLRKPFETRTRDTLRSLVGLRVLLAETGHGRPLVRGSATIKNSKVVSTRAGWEMVRKSACIRSGSRYDWKPWTRKKVLYYLSDVCECVPFVPPEGIRHGYVWMEYNPEITDRIVKIGGDNVD